MTGVFYVYRTAERAAERNESNIRKVKCTCKYMYWYLIYTVADPGISKRGGGPGAVEFLGLGFVLMPLHTYPICL